MDEHAPAQRQITLLPITPDSIRSATYIAVCQVRDVLRDAEDMRNDTKHDQRLQTLECIACYYGGRRGIAGQAFTRYHCRNCGGEHQHHNTNVPKYCDACAKEHGACTRCGAAL